MNATLAMPGSSLDELERIGRLMGPMNFVGRLLKNVVGAVGDVVGGLFGGLMPEMPPAPPPPPPPPPPEDPSRPKKPESKDSSRAPSGVMESSSQLSAAGRQRRRFGLFG